MFIQIREYDLFALNVDVVPVKNIYSEGRTGVTTIYINVILESAGKTLH